jgi:hypothetical protein
LAAFSLGIWTTRWAIPHRRFLCCRAVALLLAVLLVEWHRGCVRSRTMRRQPCCGGDLPSYEDRHVSARECVLPALDRRRFDLVLAPLFALTISARRSVAQLVRAPVSKTGGWGFESLLSCQSNQYVMLIFGLARTINCAVGKHTVSRNRKFGEIIASLGACTGPRPVPELPHWRISPRNCAGKPPPPQRSRSR